MRDARDAVWVVARVKWLAVGLVEWCVAVGALLKWVKCDRALGLLVLGLVKWCLACLAVGLVQWERALVVVVLALVGSGEVGVVWLVKSGRQWLCLVTSLVKSSSVKCEVKWEVTVKWERVTVVGNVVKCCQWVVKCGQWVVKWVVKWTPWTPCVSQRAQEECEHKRSVSTSSTGTSCIM